MLKNISLVMFVLALLFSKNVSAGETAMETLYNLYRTATEPANYADFKANDVYHDSNGSYSKNGSFSKLTCRIATYDSPDEIQYTYIVLRRPDGATLLRKATAGYTIPEVPAHDEFPGGPAFPPVHVPAQPEVHVAATSDIWLGKIALGGRWVESLTFGPLFDDYDKSAQADWDVFKSYETKNDLVLSITKNNRGIFSDLGNDFDIRFRKSEGRIYFASIVTRNGQSGIYLAGYCY